MNLNEEKILIHNYDETSQYGIINRINENVYNTLLNKYKIIIEPIGTPILSRHQNKILINPFIINLYDLLYLQYLNVIKIKNNFDKFNNIFSTEKNSNKFKIYCDLKQKNFYIICGKKYGCDFLIYKNDPNFCHSDYLVKIINNNNEININDIILNERISVNIRKKILFVFVVENQIKYINFKWKQI